MTEVFIQDEGGDSIRLIDFGDYRSSFYGRDLPEIVEIQRKLPDFTFRDDDILVVSYPKTGCTWTHELVSMVMRGTSEVSVHNKMESMLEVNSLEDLDSIPSPRLLNTHRPFARVPEDYHKKRVRTIFVLRNPKDTAVSLYHHMTGMIHYRYSGTFSNWLPLFLKGKLTYIPYYNYLKGWVAAVRADPQRFLMVYYEDLKKDTTKEIRRIAEFLDADLSEELIADISATCQFQAMRSRNSHKTYGNVVFKEGAPGFFRKGDVGDWQNWFTVAQSELFDEVFGQNLKDCGLNFVYTLQ